jgi:hypothetical protein
MLRKGFKSLQLSLNELIPKLNLSELTVSNMAYCKAKHKFKHTAFLELNKTAVVETMYENGNYKTWRGLRLLGIDGSKIQLPDTDEIKEAFGSMPYVNKTHDVSGEHNFALASICYDILNRIAINAQFLPCHTYEVDAAAKHLQCMQTNDLGIYDRGYASFRMLALLSQSKGNFLIRCPSGRFKVATTMLRGEGDDDIVCEINAPAGFTKDLKNQGLPTSLTVRFVRVALDNGEYEVLVTSLLEQQEFPTSDFKELYYLRWGVETFFGILKTRLGLENFSGYYPEAIRQDFFSTVFLCGIESIFIADSEETLNKQRGGLPKKVNKAVSFNAIKDKAFELFLSDESQEQAIQTLDALFLTNPTRIRKDRNPPRKPHAASRVLSFYKRKRKIVF